MRYLICLSFLLTSCSMYKKDFDCPPGPGIKCTPVTTLEKMIVEADCGDDIFLGCAPKLVDIENKNNCRCTDYSDSDTSFQRRIWVASKGERSSYLYFKEEFPCDEQ